MLAYAAARSDREAPRRKTLALIVAGHALALAAVMLARGDLHGRGTEPPLVVEPIPIPPDPPPLVQPVHKQLEPAPSHFRNPKLIIDNLPVEHEQPQVATDPGPTNVDDGRGTDIQPSQPAIIDPPINPHLSTRIAPRLVTPEALLRPPYPDSKRMLGEEATLTLKLTIDTAGRVVAVEPVGAADRAFLDSARRHLLRSWRFMPATEDGKAVGSTKVITLHFELGDA